MGLGATSPINRFSQLQQLKPQDLGSNGKTFQACQQRPSKTKITNTQPIDPDILALKFADDTRGRLEANG